MIIKMHPTIGIPIVTFSDKNTPSNPMCRAKGKIISTITKIGIIYQPLAVNIKKVVFSYNFESTFYFHFYLYEHVHRGKNCNYQDISFIENF